MLPLQSPRPVQLPSLRAAHPGTLLAFRYPSGYVLFDADAAAAGQVLDGEPAASTLLISPACMELAIVALLEAGHQVAVCEQVGDHTPNPRLN